MKISFKTALKILVVCIIVAALADVADIVFYNICKHRDGYSFLEPTSLAYKLAYLKTWQGFVLTFLGFFPYFLGLACLQLARGDELEE